jgi:hypothetical protein
LGQNIEITTKKKYNPCVTRVFSDGISHKLALMRFFLAFLLDLGQKTIFEFAGKTSIEGGLKKTQSHLKIQLIFRGSNPCSLSTASGLVADFFRFISKSPAPGMF